MDQATIDGALRKYQQLVSIARRCHFAYLGAAADWQEARTALAHAEMVYRKAEPVWRARGMEPEPHVKAPLECARASYSRAEGERERMGNEQREAVALREACATHLRERGIDPVTGGLPGSAPSMYPNTPVRIGRSQGIATAALPLEQPVQRNPYLNPEDSNDGTN